MSTAVILQARTGSTRLPNKMLMPFHHGKGSYNYDMQPVIPTSSSTTSEKPRNSESNV